jgi:hypothetical protein
MSSTNKTANYELSQFVGTDIPSILNDYNGDMRKIDSAIKNASVAGGDNAVAIAELQSTTARMNTEIGGINSTVNTIGGKVVGIEEIIPATASAENKLLTAQELPEIPSIEGLEADVAQLQEDISNIGNNVDAIQLCVPTNASSSNKFATMADVGSGMINERFYSYSSNLNYAVSKVMQDLVQKYPYSSDPNLDNIYKILKYASIIVDGDVFKCISTNNNATQSVFQCIENIGMGTSVKEFRIERNPDTLAWTANDGIIITYHIGTEGEVTATQTSFDTTETGTSIVILTINEP